MQQETISKLIRWTIYSSLFCFSFLFFLYMTFPYDLLFRRIMTPIQEKGKFQLTLKTLSPYYLSGIQATNVNFQRPVSKGTAEVQLDSLYARLSLLPLLTGKREVSFKMALAQGGIEGTIIQTSKKVHLDLKINKVQLGAIGPPASAKGTKNDPVQPLFMKLFFPVYGQISGTAKLTIPMRKIKGRIFFYPHKMKGNIKLEGKGLSVGPGTIPNAKMGELPMPLIRLGKLNLLIKVTKGTAHIKNLWIKGSDGEVRLKAKLKMKKRMKYGSLKGKLRFNVSKSFLTRKTSQEMAMFKGFIEGMLSGRRKRGGFYECKLYLPFRGRPKCNIR